MGLGGIQFAASRIAGGLLRMKVYDETTAPAWNVYYEAKAAAFGKIIEGME